MVTRHSTRTGRRGFSLVEMAVVVVLIGLIAAGAGFFSGGVGEPTAAQARSSIWSVVGSADAFYNTERRVPEHVRELRDENGLVSAAITGPSEAPEFVSVQLDPVNNMLRAASLDDGGRCWMLTRKYAAAPADASWVYASSDPDVPFPCVASAAPTLLNSNGEGTGWDNPINLP